MATQASSEDGTKNTKHHSVSLVKQFFTCCQNSTVIPKMEQRFMPGIWLGKDTTSNENLIGITNKVARARTIRRLPAPEKYNKQLMDVINRSPTLPYTTGGPYVSRPPLVYKPLRRPAAAETDTQTFGSDTAQQPQLQSTTTNSINRCISTMCHC